MVVGVCVCVVVWVRMCVLWVCEVFISAPPFVLQLKTSFEDAKQLLITAKQQHFLCLEEIR